MYNLFKLENIFFYNKYLIKLIKKAFKYYNFINFNVNVILFSFIKIITFNIHVYIILLIFKIIVFTI